MCPNKAGSAAPDSVMPGALVCSVLACEAVLALCSERVGCRTPYIYLNAGMVRSANLCRQKAPHLAYGITPVARLDAYSRAVQRG